MNKIRIAGCSNYFRFTFEGKEQTSKNLKCVLKKLGIEEMHDQEFCRIVRQYIFVELYTIGDIFYAELFCKDIEDPCSPIGMYAKYGKSTQTAYHAVVGAHHKKQIPVSIVFDFLKNPFE